MKKNWELEKQNPRLVEKLAKSLGINPVTAQVLINRGIRNEVEGEQFLNSSLFDLPSPYLLKDMDKAVDRRLRRRWYYVYCNTVFIPKEFRRECHLLQPG
jgi:hypothetical protein